ncbi:ATP-binding cassette domain-containing protein, partial [Campylobacter concisus]|uniref:ATP-binding cassette domain-containing protein n=1 Tax=Campylobacter concisus TaxID=199 RepID=UPI000CD93060
MINIRGVSLVYNQGKQNEFCALKNINLDINNGELVILKGVSGSGKSTLATNIAINQGIVKGEPLLLVDTDPQKSIATFLNIRNEENHPKAFDFAYKYGEELKVFLQDNKTKRDIVIDTGGRDSREMRIAIALSDIVIIPTIPSQFDVSVLDKMVNIIKMAKEQNTNLQTYIVIN